MKTYRVGEGFGPSGKIIDKDSKWFNDFRSAKEYADKVHKKIYVSVNHKKYVEICLKQ